MNNLFTRRHYTAIADAIGSSADDKEAMTRLLILLTNQPNFDTDKFVKYLKQYDNPDGSNYFRERLENLYH